MSLNSPIIEIDQKYASIQNDKEAANIQAAVEQMVTDLSNIIGLKDPRFACKLIKSGSFYDGTKIIQADEYDFLWCLIHLSHLVGDTENSDTPVQKNERLLPGTQLCSTSRDSSANISVHTKPYVQIFCKDTTKPHVFVRVVNESDREVWKDCMGNTERAEYLDAGKIKQAFFMSVESALEDISIHPSLKLKSSTGINFCHTKGMNSKSLRGAIQFGVPETFEFLWKEEREISVDVSVCIQLSHWPGVSDIAQNFDLEDPKFSFFKEATETGFLVVPKIDVIWRLSVATAEKFLFHYIKKTNPSLVICYRVMKYLNETHFFNENENVKLTDSYILKTVLFHFWTKQLAMSSNSTIVVEDFREVLVEMLTMLYNAMKAETLTQIFNSKCNVMKGGPWVQNCATAIWKCVCQIQTLEVTEHTLQSLLQAKIEIESPPRKKLSDYKIRAGKLT